LASRYEPGEDLVGQRQHVVSWVMSDNPPGDAMTDQTRGIRFAGEFVPGDPAMRRDFDHQFGAFVRRFREHWHIEALVDALEVIGSCVDRSQVKLQRRPSGTLNVTIDFALEPIRAQERSADTAP